jgi:hypothetical protein
VLHTGSFNLVPFTANGYDVGSGTYKSPTGVTTGPINEIKNAPYGFNFPSNILGPCSGGAIG